MLSRGIEESSQQADQLQREGKFHDAAAMRSKVRTSTPFAGLCYHSCRIPLTFKFEREDVASCEVIHKLMSEEPHYITS